MTIKLDKDRFHVEIQYLNKKGALDRKTFDGTRKEIHKAILSEKDLPAEEARQLLRSLNLPMGEVVLPGMPAESDFRALWDDLVFPEGTL